MAQIDPENLANCYLRLNGFLTTPNFVIHPDKKGSQKTDADVMGIRFSNRKENNMTDSPHFTGSRLNFVALVEVKKTQCDLNGPWTKRSDGNLQRALQAIGITTTIETDQIAQGIYDNGWHAHQNYLFSFVCIGSKEGIVKETGKPISEQYPKVPRIFWPEILNFIYERFQNNIKADHYQWPNELKELWDDAQSASNIADFSNKVQIV